MPSLMFGLPSSSSFWSWLRTLSCTLRLSWVAKVAVIVVLAGKSRGCDMAPSLQSQSSRSPASSCSLSSMKPASFPSAPSRTDMTPPLVGAAPGRTLIVDTWSPWLIASVSAKEELGITVKWEWSSWLSPSTGSQSGWPLPSCTHALNPVADPGPTRSTPNVVLKCLSTWFSRSTMNFSPPMVRLPSETMPPPWSWPSPWPSPWVWLWPWPWPWPSPAPSSASASSWTISFGSDRLPLNSHLRQSLSSSGSSTPSRRW
mmetsp:Transcript_3871/g.7808  ORF Transcript_3871/g.7808 Transcript_3871/m.7808 type:complete len:258 (+) Transcript_3871:555-1328(+)